MESRVTAPRPPVRSFVWAGYLLGFALGGLFDGILLHQILQWHHLLSALQRQPFDDLRVQVLADGLFHAAMYAVALLGLLMLLRSRHVLAHGTSGRQLVANALIGFGAWHVADAVLAHWTIGIHRIRLDPPGPLFWDLLWFFLFGVVFIAAGMLLRNRGTPAAGNGNAGKGQSAAALLVSLVAGAALVAALPPRGAATPTVTVLLRPGASPAELLGTLREIDARILMASAKGDVWVFALADRTSARAFYRHGAMFVSGTILPAGCAGKMRLDTTALP